MAKSLHILVVDDDPMIVQILEMLLDSLGHKARSCMAPLEAVDLMAEGQYDLVISDRSMPVMSGDELALKVHELSSRTRFVMISGHADMMIANGEMSDYVDRIVAKPVSLETLQEVLGSLFPEVDGGDGVALSN